MRNPTLSAVATDLIASYGNTAHHVIQAYRAGGERVASYVDQRWDRALARSSAQLTKESRENAQALHDALNGYYSKGIALTSAGADAVVDKVVELAGQGVRQAAANAGRFEEQTGTTGLRRLARATVPAAVAARKLAGQVEQRTGALAERVAGSRRKSAFAKARARKAAN